jgi:DNA-binding XRE family transcriptional regulator
MVRMRSISLVSSMRRAPLEASQSSKSDYSKKQVADDDLKQKIQAEGVLFGERLREVRQRRHVTQAELARIASMSEAYISNMEHGLKVPSLTTILRLAVALNCKVMDLIGPYDKTDIRRLIEP